MEKIDVYNLEFPLGIQKLDICGYTFEAVPNYEKIMALMPDYAVRSITGSHQVTASVCFPNIEKLAILPYQDKTLTQIYDVLYFLSIFTGRNVFHKNWTGEKPITADHRPHTAYGGQLRLSIPLHRRKPLFRIKKTGEIIDTVSPSGVPVWDLEYVTPGFDKDLEKIISHISHPDWREKYDDGYFLFLYRNMVQFQTVESSFLVAWTIWESIFSIENRRWLSDEDLRNTKSETKIAYILNKYFEINLEAKSREQVRILVGARNRLLHFGKNSPHIRIFDLNMFIWTTDQLIAEILGLIPDNTLNSRESLNQFLKIHQS